MSWFRIKNFIRFYLLAFIAAFLSLCLTFFAFWETYERVQDRNRNLFKFRAQNAKESIEKRMDDYTQILKGAQGLFQVGDSVSRTEWEAYVENLEVGKNYPGIQGIGFSAFFQDKDLQKFETKAKARGYQDFSVWPKGERPFYSSILYLEPLDFRNLRAIGYDMLSEPVRRKAMITARDTGKPALTGVVKLVQETNVGVQKGFLLYLPVYEKSKPQSLNRAERRQLLKGFAYSPFRVNDLMKNILENRFADLDIEIYDGRVISEENLLFDKNPRYPIMANEDGLHELATIQIAQRKWQVLISALPGFGYENQFPWFILGGGIFVSSLLFIILYSIANIRKSDYLNQLITDNASPALFVVDKNNYCTFMNPAAEVLTGYTFEEIQDQKLHNILHNHQPEGNFYPAAECPIVEAFKTGGSLFKHEDVFFTKSGKPFHVSINAQPIFESGKVVAHLMEVRDISQEKHAEEALVEKNKNLETLYRLGKNLSAELELKKLLQLITDSCTELTSAEFGAFFYNQKDEKGNSFMLYTLSGAEKESFSSFPLPNKTALFKPTFEGTSIVRSDDITKDPNFGKNAPFFGMPKGHLPVKSYLSVPVVSRTGQVIGGLFFGHSKGGIFTQNAEDVAIGIASQAAIAIDNSQLFQTITSKNKELIRINNDLDNFVYTASHDLKAPVLNIEGLINILPSTLEKKNPDKVLKIIEMIKVSVRQFKDTIGSLTEVSKINKNLDPELEKIDIKKLLEEVKISIQDMISQSGATIQEDLDCGPITFSKTNMKSLLLNLISNAIKYRSPARAPEIYVSCRREEERVILRVADNGLGIPENQLSKIFIMFKRYHSHVEGTGVGLYLVKRIAENYGGSVSVESELDKGTSFTVVLPQL